MKLKVTHSKPTETEIDIAPGFYRNYVGDQVWLTESTIIRCRIFDDSDASIKCAPLTESEAGYAFLQKELIPITSEEFISTYNRARDIQNEAFAQGIKTIDVPVGAMIHGALANPEHTTIDDLNDVKL